MKAVDVARTERQELCDLFLEVGPDAPTLCTGWKARGDVQRTVAAQGAGPIIVLGTTRDPVTPYVWSERLADDLASAVLVTRRGDGHTAYGRSACVDQRVEDLLLDGRAPRRDVVCGGRS